MRALRSAPPVFSTAEAERVAQDLYGLAVVAQPLTGERDANFLLAAGDGRHVLKIFGEVGAADGLIGALQHLAEQDPTLPIPRVQASLAGADRGTVMRGVSHDTCLLSFLPGEPLSAPACGAPLLRDIGRTLGRIDRALQGFFHPILAQPIAWDVRRLPELLSVAPTIESPDVREDVARVVRTVVEKLPALRGLRSQVIHGDCHAGNLLVSPAAAGGTPHGAALCGVLDFGDMMHAPVVLEAAVVMSELLTDAVIEPRATCSLLEGYATVQTLEARDVDVLFDLVTARHAATMLLHAWRSRHDPAGARVLERAAAQAGPSLERLLSLQPYLTREWHRVAGTAAVAPPATVDLGRRRRLLGAGAELFYETPLHLVRGEGVWLYDPQGRAHLDAYNNVPHVGHCHPTVVRAVQRQSAVLATHTRYLHERILEYAEQLLARCPPHLDTCLFVNSGSEANDVAWRIARFATGHRGALIMAHAYHGVTEASAALTPGAGQPHSPLVATIAPPPARLAADDTASAADLAAAGDAATAALGALSARGIEPAAFFIDTGLTSSGIYDPPKAWLDMVTGRVRSAGALVIADEVQYGLGRSGSHFWGFERRGMTPDLVTVGKPIGNGYPMGAVIGNRATIEAFQAAFGFFSTFGGNAVAASAGLAVLDVIDREGLVANARDTGRHLRQELRLIASRSGCLGDVRGSGLLLGVEVLGRDAHTARARTKEIVNALASRARVLIGSEGPGGNLLKLRPPMPFRPEHADLLAAAIGAAAAAIDARADDH